jgi:membrane protease YdiL (CAAX protease family)
MALLVLWVTYREGQTIPLHYRFADIARGAGIGLVIGVPAMLIALRGLAVAVPILFTGKMPAADATIAGTTVFTLLVLLAPFAEELFFRDILQRERGLRITIVLYAVAAVIFFLPTAGGFPVVLGAVSGATAVLGIVYAFLYERLGLTVALACHTTVNFILLFVPTVLSQLEILQ